MAISRRLRAIIGVSAVISTGACASPARTSESDLRAINSMRTQAEAAENSGNAEALLALFAEDAVMMPPNRPAVVGVPAARAFVPDFFKAFALSEQFSSQEVVVSGDWAFDRGTYTLTLTSRSDRSAVTTKGKYLWILKRSADGTWKYARTAWSPDAPSVRP